MLVGRKKRELHLFGQDDEDMAARWIRWVRGRRRLVRDAFHGGERARYALKRHCIIQLPTAIGRRERRHRRDDTSPSARLPRPPIPNVEHDLAGRPDSPPLI